MDKEGGNPDFKDLVRRVIEGDADAEDRLVRRFSPGVFSIILGIVRNQALAEDISQDALLAVIRKVRNGEIREPEKLPGFVAKLSKNHAIEHIRKIKRRGRHEDIGQAERLSDPSPSQVEKLQDAEECAEMRKLIEELGTPRDKELIFRFYIADETKEQICGDLGLTSLQFDRVLYRARERYKALYLKRKDRIGRLGCK